MNKHTWLVRLCLGFVKITGALPALLFLKPRVRLAPGAKRKLPKSCILVSNHISLMDFVLYLLVFPFRTVRFLIAEVLYNRSKIFALFLNLIGGIRVEREAKHFDCVAHALQVLDDGGTVGVFPQARLPVKGRQFPFTVSTAFIALRCDAPIIPVYTDVPPLTSMPSMPTATGGLPAGLIICRKFPMESRLVAGAVPRMILRIAMMMMSF